MKKECRLIIAVLLFFFIGVCSLSFVSAAISLNPMNPEYNLDKLNVSGIIVAPVKDANITFSIDCASSLQSTLGVTQLRSLVPGGTAYFSELLTVPKEFLGDCKIAALLSYAANSTSLEETAVSNAFRITTDLKGTFSINSSQVQLGQHNTISGFVQHLDNSPVTGIAKIYFNQAGTTFFVGEADMTAGILFYDFDSAKVPAGSYAVVAKVSDVYGNTFPFSLPPFVVTDKILISAVLDSEQYLPGSSIIVSGYASPELAVNIDGAEVTVTLDNSFFKTQVADSKFLQTMVSPKNIKSGKHNLLVVVEDKFGNKGLSELSFSIIAVPTMLIAELNNNSFLPEQELRIEIFLYDQANDVLNVIALLQILDKNNNIVANTTISIGNEFIYPVPKQMLPGTYSVRIVAADLMKTVSFDVESFESISISFENTTIIIENTGNIAYSKPLVVNLIGPNGNPYTIVKKVSLDLAQKQFIDLNQEIPSGVYSVILPKTIEQPETIVYNVSVTDQRSLVKKAAGGLSSISGYIISPVTDKFTYMFYVVILLLVGVFSAILVTAFIYFRKRSQDYSDTEVDSVEGTFFDSENQQPKELIEPENDKKVFVKTASAEDLEAEKINMRIREKKEKLLEKEKSNSMRNDPEIRRYVSDTLEKAFPEAYFKKEQDPEKKSNGEQK